MKPIVKLSLLIMVILLVSSASMSPAQRMQQGQRDMGMVPGITQNPLTQQQRQQITQIRQETQQEVRRIRMNQNLTQQQKQQQITQAQTRNHERVMNVLTPAQRTEFQNWWQQRQGCPGGVCPVRPSATRPAGPGAGPGMGMGMGMGKGQMGMVPGLQQNPLTQQQRQQIMDIRQDAQQRMSSITNNTNLTEDQKWQQLQQIQRETHDAVVGVLTPEQQQELNNWWQSRQQQGTGMGMQ